MSVIQKLSYELYKMDWLDSHITKGAKVDALMDYFYGGNTAYLNFDDFINDVGYDGSLYVCFNEFLECEYLDEDYMKELLPDELFEAYKNDLKYDISISMDDIETFANEVIFMDEDFDFASICSKDEKYRVIIGVGGQTDILYNGKFYDSATLLPLDVKVSVKQGADLDSFATVNSLRDIYVITEIDNETVSMERCDFDLSVMKENEIEDALFEIIESVKQKAEGQDGHDNRERKSPYEDYEEDNDEIER